LEREGCCAAIDNNKIYRYLPELPTPLPAGREESGVGRLLFRMVKGLPPLEGEGWGGVLYWKRKVS